MGYTLRSSEELPCRIVLVGSESTGKTTLAQQLVAHYRQRWPNTRWVPEYGREYTELLLKQQDVPDAESRSAQVRSAQVRSAQWTAEDFAVIAVEQQRLEDEAASAGSPVLICDTDAFATRLWERRYLGDRSNAAFDALPELPPRGLYLLADIAGVPFEPDGIRDGEDYREAMQRWFEEELTAREQPWALVSGSRAERLASGILLIDEVLRLRFGIPDDRPA